MSKDCTFNPGDFVVYPAHGVGRVTEISKTAVGQQELELIAINFDKDKLTLRIPLKNAHNTGLRQVADAQQIEQALHVLSGKAKVKRVQWSKRAAEYNSKINSGDVIACAEVIRDLYKHPTKGEQTYSERQIYEQAIGRLASEVATVQQTDEKQACAQLETILQSKFSV